jgi:hypothetical protein
VLCVRLKGDGGVLVPRDFEKRKGSIGLGFVTLGFTNWARVRSLILGFESKTEI